MRKKRRGTLETRVPLKKVGARQDLKESVRGISQKRKKCKRGSDSLTAVVGGLTRMGKGHVGVGDKYGKRRPKKALGILLDGKRTQERTVTKLGAEGK